MSVNIRSNIASLGALRELNRSTAQLQEAFARLSSGLRINRASDDAAGLAIAESLNADARVYAQGIRNLNDGISLLNIADSALESLSAITVRQRELVTQAANGVITLEQRKALHEEAQALTTEYNRIINSVEFNDRDLLQYNTDSVRIQEGYGLNEGISVALTEALSRLVGDGTFQAAVSISGGSGPVSDLGSVDLNGDGHLDLVSKQNGQARVFLGDGTGGFSLSDTLTIADGGALEFGDVNGDGNVDVIGSANGTGVSVFLGAGDGTFGSATNFTVGTNPQSITLGDFNRDGRLDIATGNESDSSVSILLGNGDGSFQASLSFAAGGQLFAIKSGDFNGDGIVDLVTGNLSGNDASLLIGNGDGTFKAATALSFAPQSTRLEIADFNHDGYLDIALGSVQTDQVGILLGNGDGTFGAARSYSVNVDPRDIRIGDFDGDGYEDIATTSYSPATIDILRGNGDGTFKEAITSTTNGLIYFTSGDFDGDDVLDFVGLRAAGAIQLFSGDTRRVTTTPYMNITTQESAREAMAVLDNTLERINAERGAIGAMQSRLETAIANRSVGVENIRAAESRIRDADIAEETSKLVRANILQQAAAALLGQANQQPALALSLLG